MEKFAGRDITRYTQKAIMFADGAKGSFRQQWMVLRDHIDTGIRLNVACAGRDQPILREYHFGGQIFEKGEDVLAAFEASAAANSSTPKAGPQARST